MNPGEVIYFSIIGFIVLIAMIIIWLIFRKKKRIAMILVGVLMVGYIGYYFYYPTLKVNIHEKRYAQMTAYLLEKYPGKDYEVSPKHYEDGYHIGEFRVNEVGNKMMGGLFQVGKEGQVTEKGTWSNLDYPSNQEEVWRDLVFEDYEGLDSKIPEIVKKDEWFEGELTVFGLTIDDDSAIALFNYSREGSGLIELKKAEQQEFVIAEVEDYVFVYVDEAYEEDRVNVILANGEEFALDIGKEKGKLIVRALN